MPSDPQSIKPKFPLDPFASPNEELKKAWRWMFFTSPATVTVSQAMDAGQGAFRIVVDLLELPDGLHESMKANFRDTMIALLMRAVAANHSERTSSAEAEAPDP